MDNDAATRRASPEQLRMVVDGPFSLTAAAAFGFGPSTGRPYPGEDLMRLAFVTDDLQHQVGVLLSQEPSHAWQPSCCLHPGYLPPRVGNRIRRQTRGPALNCGNH